MNILVPYLWLKEHLETPATVEDIQRLLSLSGPSVERIEEKHGDKIFDIEITTNRMDSASIHGIAREAAVILTSAKIASHTMQVKQYAPKKDEVISDVKNFPIHIQNDNKLCSRVTCVVLRVKTKPSPEWLQTRLEQVGVRSLNNVIDITNYVMTEIGQPTHAFDADRLGNNMIIRASKKGESITTLDGKMHTLSGGDIVIDNGKGELVDLVSIMGTANSVVQNNTQRVLFFIEHADPSRIRKTSMGLAIRTSAAQLNEKMLDPNLVMDAMLRGIALFQEVADATLESPILDLYPSPIKPTPLNLSSSLVEKYLGISIPLIDQQKILERLGCVVKPMKTGFTVTVPTFRSDLAIPVDLVEEIARVYGYHNLPSTLMDTPIPTAYPEDTNFALEYNVKQFLATLGWQEVYTYSMVSDDLIKQSGTTITEHLKLQNPLNDEHLYLRQSLVPSLEETIAHNSQFQKMSIFELAHVYLPQNKALPIEELHLTLVSTQSFRWVKGQVEALLAHLYIPASEIEVQQKGDRIAEMYVAKKYVGSLRVGTNGHVFADLIWNALLRVARNHPTYVSISPYALIIEDMTFTVPEKTLIGEVIGMLSKLSPLIDQVSLKDVYMQNISFTISYLDRKKQITSDDVQPLRKIMIQAMKEKYHAAFVGKEI